MEVDTEVEYITFEIRAAVWLSQTSVRYAMSTAFFSREASRGSTTEVPIEKDLGKERYTGCLVFTLRAFLLKDSIFFCGEEYSIAASLILYLILCSSAATYFMFILSDGVSFEHKMADSYNRS